MRFLTVLGVLASGCVDTRSWTSQDSWLRPFPKRISTYEWTELDRSLVREVSPERLAEAEKHLSAVSIRELTKVETAHFTPGSEPNPPERRAYLVRAVVLNVGTGVFSVVLEGDRIRIHHGSLGRRPVPMKRRALVVYLDRVPKEVFVTCSMAH